MALFSVVLQAEHAIHLFILCLLCVFTLKENNMLMLIKYYVFFVTSGAKNYNQLTT